MSKMKNIEKLNAFAYLDKVKTRKKTENAKSIKKLYLYNFCLFDILLMK